MPILASNPEVHRSPPNGLFEAFDEATVLRSRFPASNAYLSLESGDIVEKAGAFEACIGRKSRASDIGEARTITWRDFTTCLELKYLPNHELKAAACGIAAAGTIIPAGLEGPIQQPHSGFLCSQTRAVIRTTT
jgi:hypothetical protein